MQAKEHIKVRTGEDNKTVTLFPNPKTPDVELYFIASSADSAMSAEARAVPVNSVTLPLNSEKKIEELIILETRTAGKWYNHFLKVTWKQNGRPYIDLDIPWTPASGKALLANSIVAGRVQLSMVIGKNDQALKCSASAAELPKGYHFVPADLLCKVAVGTLSPSALRRRVVPVENETSSSASPPAADVADLSEKYEILEREYKRLLVEKDLLENKLDVIDSNARVLGGVIYKVWELATGTLVRGSTIRAEVDPYVPPDPSNLVAYSNLPQRYVVLENYRHMSR